jgi:pyridoxine 5-phosphate synthase
MTKLSVNINKVALLRNARLGNLPDLFKFAEDCENFGAEGITVHPRPDERHIRYSDIPILRKNRKTEFNIEGYPNRRFMELIIENNPDQCTLVPDGPGVLTSDKGWNSIKEKVFLKEITQELQHHNIRVSIFVDADEKMVEGVAEIGAERIELYTGDYAHEFLNDPIRAVNSHVNAARCANSLGLEINAGHDLNLKNLFFYKKHVPELKEVSIGHALVADSLYYGIQNSIQLYLRELNR